MILLIVLVNCVFILVFSTVTCVQRDPTTLLKAVPKLENVENFFLRVREANAKLKEDQLENIKKPQIKSRICKHIFKSSVFRKLGIKYAKMNQWSSSKYWLFKMSDKSLLKKVEKEDGITFKTPFTLPYKKRNFYVGKIKKDVEENSFRCIGVQHGKRWYVDLFVSEEYNVNLDTSNSAKYVPGRFVFKYDDQTKKVSPQFVAVKPADVLQTRQRKLEALYQEARTTTIHSETDDPVCRLNRSTLIQICHSALNTWQIVYDYILRSYDEENIRCEQNIVYFRYYSNEIKRRERMINCRTTLMEVFFGTYISYEFYVSYGSGPENFFVYRADTYDDKIYIYNLSSNLVKYYMDQ